jgi:hypothetical protein
MTEEGETSEIFFSGLLFGVLWLSSVLCESKKRRKRSAIHYSSLA